MVTRTARILAALVIMVTGVAVGIVVSSSPGSSTPQTTVITLQQSKPYSPQPPPGGTDDYHCTLLDPHLTSNMEIVGSQFLSGSQNNTRSNEVHHAILFLVPPQYVGEARAANVNGKGWTCFGETALPHTFPTGTGGGDTPWLAAWAPGVPYVPEPSGTGVPFPKGSMVIMQVHYNTLITHVPEHPKLQLRVVPASTPLKPLGLDLMPAPPDVPCPANVTGPLCNRSASLANLAQRTGRSQVGFVDAIESICGRNPADPPAGDTTSCTWPVDGGREILRTAAHMHLLGTPQARTLLDVSNYDFNNQAPYNLNPPVITKPGDHIGVTCTYDPTLAQELPQLRKKPPHFVTWGDGSSDEMCLALVMSVAAPKGAQPSTGTGPVQTKQL
jgi:hypothetical protein